MANGHEKSLAGDICGLTAVHIPRAHAGDAARAVIAQNLGHFMMPQHVDLGVFEQAVLHDLFRPQRIAAVDQRDMRGKVGQKQRLFHRRIAAADHHHLLAAIEEAVAGGAGGNAEALEMLFRRQAKPFCLCAGRQNDGVSGIGGAGIGLCGERAAGQVQRCDMVRNHLGPHRLGMGLHPDHQIGTHDMGVARPVLDLGRDRQLAARLDALHQDRVQHGACRVDGGRIARRAGADDQNPGMPCLAHDRPAC